MGNIRKFIGILSTKKFDLKCGMRGSLSILIITYLSAFADEAVELGQSRQSLDRFTTPSFSRSEHASGEASFEQNQYLSHGQTAEQRDQYTSLGLDLNFRANDKDFKAAAHAIYQGSPNSSIEHYYGIPELFIGEQKASGLFLTVGRQKRHWSRLDEEFAMGIWQPQLRWDYLDPIQQGLTGVFFDYQLNSTLFTFFTSGVFLPDQGPNYRLRNGEFESENRWFFKPQPVLLVLGQKRPLSYELENPRTEDVVFQSSFGGQIYYHRPETAFWVQGSAAIKPMNQMHLGFECDACTGTNFDVVATIHPSVLLHRVVTVESGLDDEVQKGWVSITRDEPLTPKGSPDWIQSSHSNVWFTGVSYARAVNIFRRPAWVKLSYLQAFEEKQRVAQPNSFVDERVESSLDRFPYQQIAAVEWTWLISQKVENQWGLRTRYTYSIPERGSWFSSQVWLQRRKWGWNLGVDILGAEIDPDSANAGLFSRYRANDRAAAGMSYAF